MSKPAPAESSIINDILIRGSDYLKTQPDFKLVGRDEELVDLQTILMRKDANGVILTGAAGVGMTSICLGLQAGKSDLKTPMDIVNLRFFWLDTDKLFESGNHEFIHKIVGELRATLRADPKTVLVIENTGNFVDAARNSGCSTIINAFLGDVKNARYQCIFEVPYVDLAKVLKCDSDMQSEFTLLEIKEPKPDDLRTILKTMAPTYEKHHGIRIASDALETAAMLSEKYKTKELPAQPSGALTLIDRAMSTYRLKAHSEPFKIQALLAQLKDVDEALKTGNIPASLNGKTQNELESMQTSLQQDIKDSQSDWDELQINFRRAYEEKRSAEQGIRTLEESIEAENTQSTNNDLNLSAAASDAFAGFDEVETSEVLAKRKQIKIFYQAAEASGKYFKELEEKVNNHLQLTSEHILAAFSRISGIPVNKLTQDERHKLLHLDKALKSRVFGQDHAVDALSDAIRAARMGLQEQNKPQACFMFQGPSGTGKTEIVKALGVALFDDESAILRLDMSEFMEKHTVARLVGAPPGYAGFEEGGYLTNEMEKNPNRVILVDEIEKAHPDIFNIFLQVLDDARLTSGTGVTSNFENTIIIMTTNIGAHHFLNQDLTFEEASASAKKELSDHFRNEFLNRFAGKENIIGFKKLEVSVLESVAKRELRRLNDKIKERDLSVTLSEEDIHNICTDRYDPANGARAIPGYFAKTVRSKVAKFMLEHPDTKGVLRMSYDRVEHDVVMSNDYSIKGKPANDIDLKVALTDAAAISTIGYPRI